MHSCPFLPRIDPHGHVWKIVENPPNPESSNWVALGWVSLETNARSQSALPSGTP